MIFACLLLVAAVNANGLNWNSPDWPSQDELNERELRAMSAFIDPNGPQSRSVVPQSRIGVPQSGSGGPPTGSGGPPTGSGGPPTGSGGPPTGSGVPQSRSGVPQSGSGGPPTGSGGPPTGSGGPPTGSGGPPTGSGGPPTGSGGPPTGSGGPPTGSGGPQSRSDVPPSGPGGPPSGTGGPPSGDEDLGAQLANLKAMAELLEQFGKKAESRPFPNMAGIMDKSPIDRMIEIETSPLPKFTFPEFYSQLNFPERIYDSIDYEEARPKIEEVIKGAIDEGLPPRELMEKIAPILYRLRSGCTVNVLQKWLSVAFKQWSADETRYLTDFVFYNSPEPVFNLHEIMLAVQKQVMSEVERTIFGPEFEGFLGVTRFMTKAVSFLTNPDARNSSMEATGDPIPPQETNDKPDPVDVIFGLSRYVLQCTPRTTYLQGFLSRLEKLRKNILFVEPFPFTVRVLKTMPPPCENPRQIFEQTYDVIKNILRKLQNSLGQTMFFVETALIFKNDDPIWNVFPNLIGQDGTFMLLDVLARLRNPPVQNSSEPYRTDTVQSTPEPYTNTSPVPPPASVPTSSPTDTTETPSPEPVPTGTLETPSRRNENDLYNQSKLLELLLKRLVSEERNSS